LYEELGVEVSEEERGLRVWKRAIINVFLGNTEGKRVPLNQCQEGETEVLIPRVPRTTALAV
jgi:hypothetical protein